MRALVRIMSDRSKIAPDNHSFSELQQRERVIIYLFYKVKCVGETKCRFEQQRKERDVRALAITGWVTV